LEPKLIEIPGIPGKLREQSLDEFLSVLTPDHLARQQLNEIRAQALKSVELSTQLMQANEKILELQNKLMAIPTSLTTSIPLPQPVPQVYIGDPPGTMGQIGSISSGVVSSFPASPQPPADPRSPFPKVECPHCKKLVSASPAGWAAHQRNAHPDDQAPRPQV